MPRRSVLAMAVLSMLTEEPMHAYRMQQLIKERHKDDVVNVAARNSVYQAIDRLLRAELIEVESTGRSDNRPERTVYRITPAGQESLREWLTGMLEQPAAEFPEFPAALAFLPSLPRAEAVAALGRRRAGVQDQLTGLTDVIAQVATFLHPVFLVEDHYRVAVLTAELAYLDRLLAQLASGEVTWPDPAWAAASGPGPAPGPSR
jgi:DNA-binding PadR family transcriptional regulator